MLLKGCNHDPMRWHVYDQAMWLLIFDNAVFEFVYPLLYLILLSISDYSIIQHPFCLEFRFSGTRCQWLRSAFSFDKRELGPNKDGWVAEALTR